MQNQTKTNTRLAFIQFIFSSFFLKEHGHDEITSFQKYFNKLSVSTMEQNKEYVLTFNNNFFEKLCLNYFDFIKNNDVEIIIDNLLTFDRKFSQWDKINKAIILSILSEFTITELSKIKIILNDYIEVSKFFVSLKETKLINFILDKLIYVQK